MAVQIPRVNRIQPTSATPDSPRIQGGVQDSSQSILNRTRQISQVVGQGADIYQAYEDDKINQLSGKNDRDIDTWMDEQYQRVDEVMKRGEDPTALYSEIENELKLKEQELLNQHEGASERVKRHLKANMEKSAYGKRRRFMSRKNKDIETYDHAETERNIKYNREIIVDNSGFIRGSDKGTLFDFKAGVKDLSSTIAKRMGERLPNDAKEWDHHYRDADGNVIKYKLSDAAKRRIHDEVGKGVAESMNVLLANDKKEEAALLKSEFGKYLTPMQEAKVDKKLNEVDEKLEASKALNKMRGSDQEILQQIRNHPNDKIRNRMEQMHIGRVRNIEYLRKRKEDNDFDTMMDRIDELEQSKKPILSEEELVNDPVYKALDLSASNKVTLRNHIKARSAKSSKQKTKLEDLNAMTEMVLGADRPLHQVSRREFTDALLKIKEPSQRNVFTTAYRTAIREHKKAQRPDATRGTFNSRLNFANDKIKTRLLREGFLELKEGKTTALTEDSNKMWIEIKDEYVNYLVKNSEDGLVSEKEVLDHMNTFINDLKAKEIIKKKRGFWDINLPFFSSGKRENAIEQFRKKPEVKPLDKKARLKAEIQKQQMRANDADNR